MPGLQYYLPRRGSTVPLDELRGPLGLAHAFDAEEQALTMRAVRRGPDGGEGLIVADERRVSSDRVGYFADRQQWWRVPKSEAWVGRLTDQPVTPDDLIRPTRLPGHNVRLADGRTYLIPIARGLAEEDDDLRFYVALPRASSVDEAGKWVEGGIEARYVDLWGVAERWAVALTEAKENDGKLAFDFAESHDAALAALAANYRVGKAEVALLGLFNRRVVFDILQALIDWPAYVEFHRKKAARGGGATDGGRSAVTADTDPASPTAGPSPKDLATSLA